MPLVGPMVAPIRLAERSPTEAGNFPATRVAAMVVPLCTTGPGAKRRGGSDDTIIARRTHRCCAPILASALTVTAQYRFEHRPGGCAGLPAGDPVGRRTRDARIDCQRDAARGVAAR